MPRRSARKQESAARIVEREGEHATQPIEEAVYAPLFVTMQEDLGIGSRSERMSFAEQFRLELPVIVNLTVESHPQRPILVRHGLLAGRGQIDDGQTAGDREQRDCRNTGHRRRGPRLI